MSNVAKSAHNRKDLSGQSFGRISVIEYSHTIKKRAHWKCICKCGTSCVIAGKYLINGQTKSCGCLKPDTTRIRTLSHGESRNGRTKEYRTWKGIRTRCKNTSHHKYPIYGGRGIRICNRWESYTNFLEDMGRAPSETHSIERINVDGDYEPNNCKWATPKEQANNTRRACIIEIGGISKRLSQWCDQYNQRYHLARARILYSGWDPIMALTTPSRLDCR